MDDHETDAWHKSVSFKPRGHASGELWLLFENIDGSLPPLSEGFLGFEFHPGTSRETVLEITALLNKHIRFLTYTGPTRPEWIDQPGRGAVARQGKRK